MTRGMRLVLAVALFSASLVASVGGPGMAAASADAPLPLLRVGGATIVEGDSGFSTVYVPLDLSEPSLAVVAVRFTIASHDATAGVDFLARSAIMKFKAGLTSKQIAVLVVSDTVGEPDEHIEITLSNAVNATIEVATGVATVEDDDHDPATGLQVSIGDVTITEAEAGTHIARIALTLSQPAPSTVKVAWTIDCSSAFAGSDYQSKQHGTVTFFAGKQSKFVTFTVLADQTPEQAKSLLDTIKVTFGVATVNEASGEGTIVDDDGYTPPDPGDLAVGEMARMSVANDGAQAEYPPEGLCNSSGLWGSIKSTVSADGRYVAFVSDAANLVPEDTNGLADVFVRDRIAGTTERVSVASDGSQATSPIMGNPFNVDVPSISAGGRYVTFWSARALVSPDIERPGLYLHDRVTGVTELISKQVDGSPDDGVSGSWPAPVSADGRFVLFTSSGTNLGAADTDQPWSEDDPWWLDDVFVRDRLTGTTTLVTVPYDGSGASGFNPSMTSDGRFVAFVSASDRLVPGDTNLCADVFVRDLVDGTTERVNLTSGGEQELFDSSCGWQRMPSISADGSSVAWSSEAWNTYGFASAPPYTVDVGRHLYVRDLANATTERIDDFVAADGDSPPDVRSSDLSDDGRYVSYGCICDVGPWSVYVYDRTLGENTLIGGLPDGTPSLDVNYGNFETPGGSISGDGHYVVIDSDDTNIVPDDTNEYRDVFIQRIN
jgi:Tol biopolymer transport system component